jgi:hypothetical protein
MIRGGFLSAEDRRHLIALARDGSAWLGRVAPDAAGERFGAAGRRVELSINRGCVFVERRHDPRLAQAV